MVSIRPYTKEDFAAVQAIYQEGINTGNATFQQQAKSESEWESSMLPECRLVAEQNGQIVGWAALSSVSSRAVYAGVCEVSVYVKAVAQGLGVGRALLQRLITESEYHDIWTLQAGIFPENEASIKLHEKCGFRIIGMREKIGQMNGIWRDSVFLERRSTKAGV